MKKEKNGREKMLWLENVDAGEGRAAEEAVGCFVGRRAGHLFAFLMQTNLNAVVQKGTVGVRRRGQCDGAAGFWGH